MIISPRIRWLVKNVQGKRILDLGFVGEQEPLVHNLIKKKIQNLWWLELI